MAACCLTWVRWLVPCPVLCGLCAIGLGLLHRCGVWVARGRRSGLRGVLLLLVDLHPAKLKRWLSRGAGRRRRSHGVRALPLHEQALHQRRCSCNRRKGSEVLLVLHKKMFAPRKPDINKAIKELNQNLVLFGVLVATVRLVPYVLHALN